jgi:hypothetical protein
MHLRCWLTIAATALPLLAFLPHTDAAGEKAPTITWKKTVIDKAFRSEGVAVADVNKDGKMDILVGDVWYEAPDWKVHPIRKPGNYGDGSGGYSQCFACWAEDINGDGWPDLIVIGFPGAPCYWYENPKGSTDLWKQHEIWHSACNETPLYVDLFGTGKRVLVMGFQPKGKNNEGQMAWFAPGKDPTQTWEMHPISEPSQRGKEVPGTQRFSHGLGVGDINGDGKNDVMCTGGWWEQPAKDDGVTPWKFHPAALGGACADMYAYDVDGDGKNDVISSSAHDYDICWYKQRGDGAFPLGSKIFRGVSQTHALHCVDINGDGLKDLVTGKRWWAHGPGGDADPSAPADLYWFEAQRGKDGMVKFVPHRIDDDSGIGTQFAVADVNGDKLLDIIISNKKGVFLFEQVRK